MRRKNLITVLDDPPPPHQVEPWEAVSRRMKFLELPHEAWCHLRGLAGGRAVCRMIDDGNVKYAMILPFCSPPWLMLGFSFFFPSVIHLVYHA